MVYEIPEESQHLPPLSGRNRLAYESFQEWILSCCCLVTKSCLILCDPMDCSTPGFPALHYLPEFAQTQVHWVERHPTNSSSVIPFSSWPQSFPASGSFPVNRFFPSGDHSIGASASASVLSMNIQDWFPLALTGWIPFLSKGLSRVFPSTTIWKPQFFSA